MIITQHSTKFHIFLNFFPLNSRCSYIPTNKTIDIYQSVRGRQVIVEGYIDFYVKDGNKLVRCIATNIMPLGIDNRHDYVEEQLENSIPYDGSGDVPF